MNTSAYVPSEESLNEEGNLGELNNRELNNSTCHDGNIVAAVISSVLSSDVRVAPIVGGAYLSDNDATSMSMDEAPLRGVTVEAFAKSRST